MTFLPVQRVVQSQFEALLRYDHPDRYEGLVCGLPLEKQEFRCVPFLISLHF